MKKTTSTYLFLFVLSIVTSTLSAQTIISRFDFNMVPLTTATIGPNATSIDPDVITNGTAASISGNCQATKGIDLVVPNAGGILDQPELGMTFRFIRQESFASFFRRGGTEFFVRSGQLWINYRTDDGLGGFIDYGPFPTGYVLPNDGNFHGYTFIYYQATGIAEVQADAILVWSLDGPDNRPLYWVGAGDATIGAIMDGNCTGPHFLEYAYLFIPGNPLPVEFLSFEVELNGNTAELNWETAMEYNNDFFTVETSRSGTDFESMEFIPSSGGQGPNAYAAFLPDLTPGTHFFRITQTDKNGESTQSETRTLVLAPEEGPVITVYPNPSQGKVTLDIGQEPGAGKVRIYDLQGTLKAEMIASMVQELDLSQFGPGIYILQVVTTKVKMQLKVIVQ